MDLLCWGKEMDGACKEFKNRFTEDFLGSLRCLLKQLGCTLNPLNRVRAIKKLLREERGAIGELFRWDDPLPLLGLLYPLTIFFRHGKITLELLVSKTKLKEMKCIPYG